VRGFTIIPAKTTIPFIAFHKAVLALSLVMMVGSIALFAFRGLNYGVDFVGGILIEARSQSGPVDVADLRSRLGGVGLGAVELQEFGSPEDVMIRIQKQEGGEEAQRRAVEMVQAELGPAFDYRRVEFVGPKVSEDLFWNGIYALGASILSIMIYVWFRFEWQFGVASVIALIHDVLTTIGLFSLLSMDFDLTIIAALLTIVGYSINDTVVVFDRVREDLRKYKTTPLPELLDRAMNETLSRTVITGGTTLLATLALYLFGGEVIRGFSFAMLWGIIIGTYSSVCLATPLLLYMNIRRDAVAGLPGERPAVEAPSPPVTGSDQTAP